MTDGLPERLKAGQHGEDLAFKHAGYTIVAIVVAIIIYLIVG